jgi:2-dehydro-3-deoxy-D-arabinonate dehydratase
MQLCRFHHPDRGARLGQMVGDQVYDLTSSGSVFFGSLSALLQASVSTPIPMLLADVNAYTLGLPPYAYADLDRAPDETVAHLLPPIDRQEVWAAGVTYAWSREARVREAKAKDVYVQVYEADRPELFLKCLGEKAVGPNDWVGIRGDSEWNVPEPELTLVLNPALEIVGYTAGNDVSSRDIEGENPLYLPQAKVYRHSCALGPVITLADDTVDPANLNIQMTITRGEETVFRGEVGTDTINRALEDLAAYLGRYEDFPHGVLLMTGTGIVPEDAFTLQDGDRIAIEIEAIGVLHNVVGRM